MKFSYDEKGRLEEIISDDHNTELELKAYVEHMLDKRLKSEKTKDAICDILVRIVHEFCVADKNNYSYLEDRFEDIDLSESQED